MRAKKFTTHFGDNLEMSNEVYGLRREVMTHIYAAKTLLRDNGITMPRQTIRIISSKKSTLLGVGRMKGNIVWITELGLKYRDGKTLKNVVFHELLHSILGIQHDDNCPLMHPIIAKAIPNDQLERVFLSYFK